MPTPPIQTRHAHLLSADGQSDIDMGEIIVRLVGRSEIATDESLAALAADADRGRASLVGTLTWVGADGRRHEQDVSHDPYDNANADAIAAAAGRNNPEYYAQWRESLDNREWIEGDWKEIVAVLGADGARLHSRDLFESAVLVACAEDDKRDPSRPTSAQET